MLSIIPKNGCFPLLQKLNDFHYSNINAFYYSKKLMLFITPKTEPIELYHMYDAI